MKILGLLTTILGMGAIILHYFVKVLAAEDGVSMPMPFNITDLRTIRTMMNQVLLVMSVTTAITGFADLSAISLCFTYLISLQTAVTIGFSLAGVCVFGSVFSGLDILLSIRDRKPRDLVEIKGGEN